MVDAKLPTTINPRCLQVIPSLSLSTHVHSEALPLTGFCRSSTIFHGAHIALLPLSPAPTPSPPTR